METIQDIQKTFSFDAGHRIVNHKSLCGNVHGHLWYGTLTFSFNSNTMEDPELGYAIDFSEIKRIGLQFISDFFDHSYIANPKDYMCDVLKNNNSRMWLMSLNGEGNFCNPSVENMAKELFLTMNILFENRGITIKSILIHETPSSSTICTEKSMTLEEVENFNNAREEQIRNYAYLKGIQTYNKTTIN